MNDKIDRLRLAAEDAAGGPPSAEQVDALVAYADALEAALAARQPTEDDREALAKQLRDIGAVRKVDQDCSCEDCDGTAEWVNAPLSVVLDHLKTNAPDAEPALVFCAWCPQPARGDAWHNDGKLHPSCGQIDHGQGWVPPYTPRATVPDAATELAAIKARADEVGEDEGWHIGGAWGDYGEVVVPLRILSYVVDGALDEKVVSTDPGYAATYAEQVARADRAGAERDAARKIIESHTCGENVELAYRRAIEAQRERDAALAAVERVAKIHGPSDEFPAGCDYCERLTPCSTRVALDGAPEPEWEYSVGFNDPECGWINDHADIHDNYEDARSDYSEPHWLVEDRVVRRRPAGPWEPVEGESK